LAIVKRLLMLFGSTVQLASQPGEGAVFTFAITFNRCKDERPVMPLDRTEPSGLAGLKVLIVEDNKVNVLLLERLLVRWGVQTAVAINGQEAIDILLKEPFDLVLMDLHMPVMDGYDATRAIRTFSDPIRARVPILALTASVSQNVYSLIKQVGMQDYLPKPFHADQLHQKLQELCAVRR
jgi:CheY-like chemotaxis protein